jgi:hypothetical protein
MGRVQVTTCSMALFALAIGSAQQPSDSAAVPATRASQQMPRGDLEHGRYLVENVAMCVQCHSTRDKAGEIIPETRFHGGPIPVRPPWPNDWAVRAPRNAGLLDYTDEQAIRLLTQGAIDRRGEQLRPPMPRFHMTPQDAADVIAYMRSMK